ncbi:KPN_02809 family neutral zinc metallopeptidase [Persicirhabdus sediminis]|uniref:Neutral zinc metallopeptidase n=1 Tax=Persicirhabdus sediminis TaxID=454144 RepID=A0A8J7MKD6_9BACT|nr:neutral zinc metallopeptidase [Persicirhabdus sediminis]MBK1792628.1 neutral zinc metallopeptidase [Persicirhabdus sediminis]
MKWKGRRRSSHVEDRRGQQVTGSSSSRAGAGLLLGLFMRAGGKTKILIVVGALVAIFVFKINPQTLLQFASSGGSAPQVSQVSEAPNDEMRAYLETIKADNEDVWAKIFQADGKVYKPSKMVIYHDKTPIPGGLADSRMGPFYMPANETIYIDPHFFNELSSKFGAQGDFAQAYVVAHEVGHHVQNLLGYSDYVHQQRGKVSEVEYNKLSVRLELQADFLAGVFAHHADRQFKEFLEQGDISEAMQCAHAIGDDTLQKSAGNKVVPDSFTHGTSEQRARWFELGYKTGDLEYGDTFSIGYSQL